MTSTTKYITLGCDCATTYFLRQNKYTNDNLITGPFDWADVSLKALINSLINFSSNNGINYTKLEIIKFDEKYPYFSEKTNSLIETKGSVVLKNKCGVKFAHEILTAYKKYEFTSILQRRIERVFANKKNKIQFIRYERPMSDKEVKTYFIKFSTVISLLNKLGFNDYSIQLLLPEKNFKDVLNNFDNFVKAGYHIANMNFIEYEKVHVYIKTYGSEEDYVYTDWKNEKAFSKLF